MIRALLLILLLPAVVIADDTVEIYQTLPGSTVRDYSAPPQRYQVDELGGNTVLHPTLPYTSARDYSRPSAVIDRGVVYPSIPGTGIRDYSKPATGRLRK
jgi:hypothetical protein